MTKEVKGYSGAGVDSWRDGHRTGTLDGFRWSMERALKLAGRAKTDEGRRALEYVAELIRREQVRRYPDKPDA